MSSAGDTDWLDLEAALVWVDSKDSEILASFLRDRSTEWDQREPIPLNAWPELRDAIADSRVRARGIEARIAKALIASTAAPKAAGDVASQIIGEHFINEDYEDENEENDAIETPSLITAQGVTSLIIVENYGHLELRPKTWALTGGAVWRNIEISANDLAMQLKNVGSEPPSARRELDDIVISFWKSTYPDGRPTDPVGVQNRKIVEELKRRNIVAKDYSDASIRSIFQRHEINRNKVTIARKRK